MIYSVGCEYAIRALTRLAEVGAVGRFSLLREVVVGSNIPHQYLLKIFQALVRADVLVSARGRGGGFALARLPGKITLRQIVEAIDGNQRINRCILGLSRCDEHQTCPQHDRWTGIRDQIAVLLDRTTLADLTVAMSAKQSKGRRPSAGR